MRQSRTLRDRIERRIARKRGEDVFLPREFRDLGGEDQVLRVLRISCVKNASCGSATGSMAAQLSLVSPAPQSYTARADFWARHGKPLPSSA